MQVMVIGAGPAGSLAAILLARAGAAVTLIEQHAFPRDKVCGECLSALGRSVLQRHDLQRPLAAIGIELHRTHLVTPDYETALTLPAPMLGITRSRLDEFLLDEAMHAGATVLQPARAEAIEGTSVRVRLLPSNQLQTYSADRVIVADGRGAIVGVRPKLTGDLGIKTHFTDIRLDPGAITLFSGAGCYGGLAPVEGGRWNAAFAVPATWVRASGGDVEAVFTNIGRRHAPLADALVGSKRVRDWLAAPLPRYDVRDDWPGGVIPVGNAACAIDPIGGEGMGTALRSAELAVDAILTNRVGELAARYRRLWRRRSWFCRAGAKAFSSDRWAGYCVALAGSESVARLGLALIGK